MTKVETRAQKKAYGDFQTPLSLAQKIVQIAHDKHNIQADIIIEPSCGLGAFVAAANAVYENAAIYGFDINEAYLKEAKKNISSKNVFLQKADFFKFDWENFLQSLEQDKYLLIIGNPPWVTNSALSALDNNNLPQKNNFDKLKGIDALTGASNFDISEWMILQYIKWLSDKKGAIVQICKYSVARKILKRLQKNKQEHYKVHIYLIDAKKYFGVSVEACVFILQPSNINKFSIYASLDNTQHSYCITERNGYLVRNSKTYDKYSHLLRNQKNDSDFIWRSGIKHDCSKIMEIEEIDNGKYKNKLGQIVELEDNFIYPLLKSSDIANNRINQTKKRVIVTQRFPGEDTNIISKIAPNLWEYLNDNRSFFEKRKSTIYKKSNSLFSIFGVGEYTFKPWKIAISGLYKKIHFQIIGPIENKPVIFDDTIYFLSFDSKEEATKIYQILNSREVLSLLDSMIFWDEKRPITAKILNRIDLVKIAKELDISIENSLMHINN